MSTNQNNSSVVVNTEAATIRYQEKIIRIQKTKVNSPEKFNLVAKQKYVKTFETTLSGVQAYNFTSGFWADLFQKSPKLMKVGGFLERLHVAWLTLMQSDQSSCTIQGGLTQEDLNKLNAEVEKYEARKRALLGVKTPKGFGQREVIKADDKIVSVEEAKDLLDTNFDI